MIQPLRDRAEQILSAASTVFLVSDGPAGLQCEQVPCLADGLRLYLLVPRTSDQLLNLEQRASALLTTHIWQLRGTACILPDAEVPPVLLARAPYSALSAWVRIQPHRLQITQPSAPAQETIDFS